MSEPSTTAGTWAPDWDELDRVYWDGRREHHQSSRGALVYVIAEYQRQAAAAGLVMVRRELLEKIDMFVRVAEANGIVTFWVDDEISEFRAALAATPEPAPGGDG